MKLGLGLVLVLATARLASADDGYPQAVVDRPLVLLPGMTELYIDQTVRSSVDDTFDNRANESGVRHAFGPVEVALELGDFAELHVSFATHTYPETLEVFAVANFGPQLAQGYLVGQRFRVVPGFLSVAGGAGFNLSEDRVSDVGMTSWEETLSGFANARIEIQAMRQLSLFTGVSVAVPLAQSDHRELRSELSASGGVIVLIGSYDIFLNGGISDVSENRLPFVTAGLSKRWGR